PALPTSMMSLPRISTKGWNISEMCRMNANFKEVPRMSALKGAEALAKKLEDYEKDGVPLVIEDWQYHPKWPAEVFGLDWLLKTTGESDIHVRNVHNGHDLSTTLSEFVKFSRSQPHHAAPGEPQRLYWKDAHCPAVWKEWLLTSDVIPSQVLPCSPENYLEYLVGSECIESLLCYMGIGDTFTTAHKDLCASSGQNLMCFAEDGGSSYWFMTATKDADKVAEYFHTQLHQELDWETHLITINQLTRAPFTVYVTQQNVGDLVMVPSRSCHQVVNHGGLALKMGWSRMTLNNLTAALRYELPVYRRVCRAEQYRTKTILYRSMLHLTELLSPAVPDRSLPQHPPSYALKLERLVILFDEVLHEEYAVCHSSLEHVLAENNGATTPSPSSKFLLVLRPPVGPLDRQNAVWELERSTGCNLACDFCGADIFQSFFECKHCHHSEDDPEIHVGDGLLVCPACYVEGRTCDCGNLRPAQCRPFDILLKDRNEAAFVVSTVLGDSKRMLNVVKR
ncbi:hypothetical protein C8Q78DRAFT_986852, partial [Trametes maxima]